MSCESKRQEAEISIINYLENRPLLTGARAIMTSLISLLRETKELIDQQKQEEARCVKEKVSLIL